MNKSIITGTGCVIPDVVKTNAAFADQQFYEETGKPIVQSGTIVVEKFKKITGIEERRYVHPHQKTSDIAAEAGRLALLDAQLDGEDLDQIIVAHNFGDVGCNSLQSQNVPAIASRVKHLLKIKTHNCVAYDILFGCPGWVQALIQSEAYFKAGMAKKVLLIGAETLSRVIDPFDRDSMIFADGAGACILEYLPSSDMGSGIIGVSACTHSLEEVDYINMGLSYEENDVSNNLFIKMKGRKVYEYALTQVPAAMKKCIDEAGISIHEVKKIFIHQANEKMDEEIIKRLYESYGLEANSADVMPMNIQWLGNSSVATVPTLFDMVRKGKIPAHAVHTGDVILFASVGAGMNINAVCYRV